MEQEKTPRKKMESTKRRLLTDDEKAEIIRLYDVEKKSSEFIAKQFGIHANTALKLARGSGCTMRMNRKLTDEQELELIEMYEEGLSMTDLEENHHDKFGLSKSGIKNILKRHKIKVRTPDRSINAIKCNFEFFNSIDNEIKAYFLGFYYADGGTNEKSINLCLAKTDIDILKKFQNYLFLDDKNHIRLHERTGPKHFGKTIKEAYLSIKSMDVAKRMTELGAPPAKTRKIKFPIFLPKELIRHFVRGYFDGDGALSIRFYKNATPAIKFTSNEVFCKELSAVIEAECGVKMFLQATRSIGIKDARNSSLPNCITLMDWMYKDATIFLQRKYARYKTLHKRNKQKNNILNFEYSKKQFTVNDISKIKNAFLYPDDHVLVQSEFDELCGASDGALSTKPMCEYLCKYFLSSYFSAGKTSIVDVLSNEIKLKEIIDQLNIDIFSFENLVNFAQNQKLVSDMQIFPVSLAKQLIEIYTNPGDTVYNFSAGFGEFMLGCIASGRKYIGTDPDTAVEVSRMAEFLDSEFEIHKLCSEDFGKFTNVKLAIASIPMFNGEIHCDSANQAYDMGENYYYNMYLNGTLLNILDGLADDGRVVIHLGFSDQKAVDVLLKHFVLEEEKVVDGLGGVIYVLKKAVK